MFYRGITPEFLLGHGINPDGLLFGPRFLPYNPYLKQFSRDLRKGYQLAEVKMWKCLRAKNMGYAFRRQYPILNYIADFYCNLDSPLIPLYRGGSAKRRETEY